MGRPIDPLTQLIYWCGCQAATLEHMCGLKSTSKSAARRQRNITYGMIETCQILLDEVDDGYQHKRLREDLERVMDRANRAVQDGQTRGLCLP